MQLETSLPDLPFENYGKAELSCTHSTAKSTPPLRTDLNSLTPWTSFPNDIHQAIQSATARAALNSTPFHITAWTESGSVSNEEDLRAYATYALHEPVQRVLKRLGVNGQFHSPGGGDFAIVGAPDFSWISHPTQLHPKVVVEYKTWWVVDLEHVAAAFNGTRGDPLNQQSLHALEQIYGYMTFNNNKFGILTNWQHALFLRRAETSDGRTLEYYTIELDGPRQPISMLKAWVGMALLVEDDYASPIKLPVPPGRNFGTSMAAWKEQEKAVGVAQGYHMQPVDGEYQCLALDFRLCCFDLSSACYGMDSCVVKTRLLAPSTRNRDLQVICKVVDCLRCPDAADSLADEARAYAALQNLQGKVIPTLYGFYDIWGILQLLALEPVGDAIPEDEQIDPRLRTKMKAALHCLHHAGFVHGDVARRNFCRTDSGDIFLVDLERCQRFKKPSELDDEMNEVDRL